MTIRIGSDDAERKVLSDVKKFGWHCLNIFGEDGQPPWTFSIGFHKTWNFPELIVIGLKREVAHSTLNIVATQLAEGARARRYTPDLYVQWSNSRAELIESKRHLETVDW
jgi:hypothetical protein